MSTPLTPDPMWSVCPVCWCVIASREGHAPNCAGTPPEGGDLIVPDPPDPDEPEEPTDG